MYCSDVVTTRWQDYHVRSYGRFDCSIFTLNPTVVRYVYQNFIQMQRAAHFWYSKNWCYAYGTWQVEQDPFRTNQGDVPPLCIHLCGDLQGLETMQTQPFNNKTQNGRWTRRSLKLLQVCGKKIKSHLGLESQPSVTFTWKDCFQTFTRLFFSLSLPTNPVLEKLDISSVRVYFLWYTKLVWNSNR